MGACMPCDAMRCRTSAWNEAVAKSPSRTAPRLHNSSCLPWCPPGSLYACAHPNPTCACMCLLAGLDPMGASGGADHKAIEGHITQLLALCRLAEEYNQVGA